MYIICYSKRAWSRIVSMHRASTLQIDCTLTLNSVQRYNKYSKYANFWSWESQKTYFFKKSLRRSKNCSIFAAKIKMAYKFAYVIFLL